MEYLRKSIDIRWEDSRYAHAIGKCHTCEITIQSYFFFLIKKKIKIEW